MAVNGLLQLCRELPAKGERFREFRSRMKEFRLWDQDMVGGTLAFLGMQRTGIMAPSPFVREVAAAAGKNKEKARALLAERLWDANPLLFKTVIELLSERVHSRADVVKHIDSFAYRGQKPTRPQLEQWLHLALGLQVLKMVGIAFDVGERGRGFIERAGALDVEEFLEDVREAEAEAMSEGGAEGRAESREDRTGSERSTEFLNASPGGLHSPEEDPSPGREPSGAPSRPAGAERSGGSGQGGDAAGSRTAETAMGAGDAGLYSSPRGQGRPVAIAQFAGQATFPDEVLAETTSRIEDWWRRQSHREQSAKIADFGFTTDTVAEAWMERSNEVLYRVAVAAALIFRLHGRRDVVVEMYQALDKAEVLHDLFYGTAPEQLPEGIDPRALMLVSLLARRFAESPELAANLERQPSASAAFAELDRALGRGLLNIELFWMMAALRELGLMRFADIDNYTALPHRGVRDCLFRLGFLPTPYAHDAATLAAASAAARRAAGTAEPPDEVLMAFAGAAGCAFSCLHRQSCEFACRERGDSKRG